MKLGFIGLGDMGRPMARNLLKAGHEVTVYNRTKARAEELKSEGAIVAKNLQDVCQFDFVLTMVFDDAAVEKVVFAPGGVLESLPAGATHILMSTVSVALAERLTEAHQQKGQHFVSAPVLGRPDAAQQAKLYIVAAGKKEIVDSAQPIFSVLGNKVFYFGETPSHANTVKLANNFLISSVVESLGEAFALIRKTGVSPETFFQLFTEGPFRAPVYQTYGALILQEQYKLNESRPGVPVPLGLKDVKLAIQAAESAGVTMPVASLIRDKYVRAIATGYENYDLTALALLSAQDAGLDKDH